MFPFENISNKCVAGGLTWLEAKLTGPVDARMLAILEEGLPHAAGRPLRLYIDSGGGDIAFGYQMFEKLQSHRPLMTVVVNEASSAASMIFLAADRRVIADGAHMVIHNPRPNEDCTLPRKEAMELARAARELMLGLYEKRTGLRREVLSRMMDAETRLSAYKAKHFGFATAVGTYEPKGANQSAVRIPKDATRH